MKYKIISNPNQDTLCRQLDEHLAEGWKLHGTLTVFNHQMVQAITKGDYVRPARLKEKKNDVG